MYYADVASGKKRFELRKNDRGFKVGDGLRLKEYTDGEETGRYIDADIVYMLEDYAGLTDGYCILGIEVVRVAETDTQITQAEKCKDCVYYGRPSDAPENTPLDCMYQPEEGKGYELPCEESEV